MLQVTFPDISNVEYGQDGTPILGNSIGNNRIFFYLRENANQQTAPLWNLFLINIYTMARNAYRKGISFEEMRTIIDKDSDLLMTYIHAYTTHKRPIDSVVLFYAPTYRAVPKDFMREHVGNNLELDTLYTKIAETIPDKLLELTELPYTRKFISRVGLHGRLPYLDIVTALGSISSALASGGSVGTAMISHCPLDFHIYKRIPRVQLLESYTGQILNVVDFGQKLTRDKDVRVPFNTATHRLFGDPLQLLPLLTGKDRKTLIELAAEKNWAIKTETQIIDDATWKFAKLMRSQITLLRL